MKRSVGAIALTILVVAGFAAASRHAPKNEAPGRPAPARVILDLDRAVKIGMPELKQPLAPAMFKAPDGRSGWALKIPGDRPIATPAYAEGKLFVGGGYGSHEFYAFDADTGRTVWKINTKDDGPTAAVVEDGCVAFNTESCTVCVVDSRSGKLLWQEWLGDPLMSQPAIANGRLYMAYPANGRGNHQAPAAPEPQTNSHSTLPYRLLCADLKTGHHHWVTPITADAISAPIIEGDRVLLTCMDGTSYSIDALSGRIVWTKKNASTSAPLVANGDVVFTLKQQEKGRSFEGIARFKYGAGDLGGQKDAGLLAKGPAEYYAATKSGSTALSLGAQKALDSSVGFGGGAPAAASMPLAKEHINVESVAAGWAYQGSRVAYGGGRYMNAQANTLNSLDAKNGKTAWKAEARGAGISRDAQLFSPPALGKRNMYLSTARGHLIAVNQKDGKPAFVYATQQPIAFQPALANGNVYAGTTNGLLICLKTGDKDADGWTAWGGNARHNKKN